MTTVRGTMGYIAPKVLSENFGNVSYKSDIYSFGMLLQEMVGGRRNLDVAMEKTSQAYFPEWVYNQLDKGEEVCIRIEEEGHTTIAKKLTIVGLWCIQWYLANRSPFYESCDPNVGRRRQFNHAIQPFCFHRFNKNKHQKA